MAPPRPGRPRAGALCAALAAAAALTLAGGAPAAAQPANGHHRLVATRTAVPWQLTAGRYGQATDIAAGPDGALYVLDAVNGAVHVTDADGRPRAVWRVPDADVRRLRSIDFEAGGTLALLSTCQNCRPLSRVDRLTTAGAPVAALPLDERYVDIAAHPDGGLFLTRPGEAQLLAEFEPAVDRYTGAGAYVASLRDALMALPQRVDIGPDGVVHVLQTVPPPPRSGGGGGGGRPPGPGPSGGAAADDAGDAARLAPAGALQAPAEPEPVPGVLVFRADLTLDRLIPFDGGIDVGAGDGLAVISGYGRIVVEGEDVPLTPLAGAGWTGAPHLAVLGPDQVAAALDHCTWQGVLRVGAVGRRPNAPWRLAGALDEPALAGPVAPGRLAAGVEVRALQDLYDPLEPRSDGFTDTPAMAVPPAGPPATQSVQAWTVDGGLPFQLGHCAGSRQADWARDVAIGRDGPGDGAAPPVYLIDSLCIVQRPDAAFPGWRYCPRGLWGAGVNTALTAVGADAAHVAALDAAAAGVVVVDAAGAHTAHWTLGDGAPGGTSGAAIDLDVRDGIVAVALRGARLVERRTPDGRLLNRFKTFDTPEAVALGPDGSVYVLGLGGWASRFGADGTLLDSWALPGGATTARDLAVDAAGRVHVAFQQRRSGGRADSYLDGGIWVYAPDAAAPPEPRPATACRLAPDKQAAPARLPLGQAVTVTLTLTGACPAEPGPLQLALVVDRSRSMGWGYTMARAQDSLFALLAALDPATTEVALVAFAEVPAVLQPLTRDLPAVARAAGALQPAGDTRPGDALHATLDLLAAARRPGVAQAIVLVTDGVPYDQSTSALDRLVDDGVLLGALVFDNGQDAPDDSFVDELRARSPHVAVEPGAAASAQFIAAVASAAGPPRTAPLLLGSGALTDVLPANMRYVPGSAVPPADYDAAARTLTWAIPAVPAGGAPTFAFRVVPQEVGQHPTNVAAAAEVIDGVGAAGRLVFPVPQVTVFAPDRIYLPYAVRQACTRRAQPLDVVLVLDTSLSMAEPAGAAGGPTKLAAAVAAARAFLDHLADDDAAPDRAAIVGFDDGARTLSPLTADRAALRAALDGARTSPGTRLDRGLAEAATALSGARPAARTAVVLLTDGRQTGDTAPVTAAAAQVRSTGAALHIVGLGADVDAPLLRSLVSAPEAYHPAADAAGLLALYRALAGDLVCR